MPIRRLPDSVANRIAAGEVIERPASIVKELIENAIDAGASRIDIEIASGGVALIRVRDDGCGIDRDDLALAFERHATSKLAEADDLFAIRTLGFRGEALPSVAAAAREVEIVSRPSSALAGARIVVKDGVVKPVSDHGAAAGTTVVVRDVFANQPARRAFLRATTTETRAVLAVVTNAALARPDVAFTLVADGRVLLRTSGGGLREAAAAAYGRTVAAELLPAAEPADDRLPAVDGLVGGLHHHRASRSGIVLIVNGRPITSRALTFAIEEAYAGLLPRGRHPIAVLQITVPLDAVDVNVHPTKAEVRFRDERAAFAAVQRAVRSALLAAAPAATLRSGGGEAWLGAAAIDTPSAPPVSVDGAEVASPRLWERLAPSSAPSESRPSPSFPPLRAVGQLRETYIVAEGPDGMYLIDQHAAHERVLFDELRSRRAERKSEVQLLLAPLTLEPTPRQALALEREADALAWLGFDLAPFGEGAIAVRALPAPLAARGDPATIVPAVLDALADDRPVEDDERACATVACHASVRAGMPLATEEQRALLRSLEATTQPRTCPHGRPTMIHLSAESLERGFGRR